MPARTTLLLSLAALCVTAQAFTLEENTSGAAAVVIVANKCHPQHAIEAERLAMQDFKATLQGLSPAQQDEALDAARRKLAAFAISSKSYQCEDVEHFKAMARIWGFGHLLLDTRVEVPEEAKTAEE